MLAPGPHTAIKSWVMSIVSRHLQTPRLDIKFLDTGGSGKPVVFIHGNISTGEFFSDLLLKLPAEYRGIAPDLRGFGDTEPKPIDATRGVDDFVDDIHSLLSTIEGVAGKRVVLCGWSVGGAVVLRFAMKYPELVAGPPALPKVRSKGPRLSAEHPRFRVWPRRPWQAQGLLRQLLWWAAQLGPCSRWRFPQQV